MPLLYEASTLGPNRQRSKDLVALLFSMPTNGGNSSGHFRPVLQEAPGGLDLQKADDSCLSAYPALNSSASETALGLHEWCCGGHCSALAGPALLWVSQKHRGHPEVCPAWARLTAQPDALPHLGLHSFYMLRRNQCTSEARCKCSTEQVALQQSELAI